MSLRKPSDIWPWISGGAALIAVGYFLTLGPWGLLIANADLPKPLFEAGQRIFAPATKLMRGGPSWIKEPYAEYVRFWLNLDGMGIDLLEE